MLLGRKRDGGGVRGAMRKWESVFIVLGMTGHGEAERVR